MKKFYMSALGCLVVMGASAQRLNQVVTLEDMDFYNLYSIPAKYAKAEQNALFSVNELDDEDDLELKIFDQSFSVVRTITLEGATNYERTEVKERELNISEEKYQSECTNYLSEPYVEETNDQSYLRYYAEYQCDNQELTDEYVYDWLNYCKRVAPYDWVFNYDSCQYMRDLNIIEKRIVNGGSFFVVAERPSSLLGFFFKDNELYSCEYWSGEDVYYRNGDHTYSYRNFYNRKFVEFSEELVYEYINYAGDYGYGFGSGNNLWYDVDRVEQKPSGETYFYTYEYEYIQGERYPTLYFVWKDETITMHYTRYSWSYSGEWVERVDDYGYDWDESIIYDIKVGGYMEEENNFFVTQNLFNDDEEWEYLRPIYEEVQGEISEQDRDGDGEIDYKSANYENKVIAYEVVSEDGTVLTTIEVPECTYCNLATIVWGGDQYLAVESRTRVEVEDYYDYYYETATSIYSIDKRTNSLQKVASTPAMRVNPTIANRNSTIDVSLDEAATQKGGELIITDSNGRTIARNRIVAGQKSARVTTDRMSSGVYNITFTEEGEKVDNARIIVK